MQLKLSNKLSDLLCEVKAQSDQSFNKLIEEAGVLSSKYLVGPLFQIHNKKLAPNEHLAEDIIASNVYDSLRMALKT